MHGMEEHPLFSFVWPGRPGIHVMHVVGKHTNCLLCFCTHTHTHTHTHSARRMMLPHTCTHTHTHRARDEERQAKKTCKAHCGHVHGVRHVPSCIMHAGWRSTSGALCSPACRTWQRSTASSRSSSRSQPSACRHPCSRTAAHAGPAPCQGQYHTAAHTRQGQCSGPP